MEKGKNILFCIIGDGSGQREPPVAVEWEPPVAE